MPDNYNIDNLKQLILIKTGLTLISPSDCKSISLAIQKETNKNISETTLKRLFGFASATSNLSKFTINALTEFVSSVNENLIIENAINYNNTIEKVAANAKQITNYTLRNIKSRCSVPYELTIRRKFASHDFHYFHESDFSFTAFIAQPGYGKTILLSHLVEDIMSNEDRNYAKDIVCYFDAINIFDTSNYQNTLEDQIKLKIGLSTDVDLISYFEMHYQESNIRLILIFDGFAELVMNRDSKLKIFNRLVDFISSINESNAVKIILSMRSTTWNRFFERIRHTYFLKKKWYPGSYYYLDYNSNVPPLSEKELEQVIEKIDPGKFKKLSLDLKSQLKFPFHIQWFYKLKEKYPSFKSYTNITFYEIIDLFIHEKIFKANYATEKILFCQQIIKLTDLSKKGNKLVKTELIPNITIYKNAYMELLAEGILMEEMHALNGYPVEYVRFVHPHVFEYFLFKELQSIHNQNIDSAFFKYLQEEYIGNQVRFQLLQWSIRQITHNGNFEGTSYLFGLDLPNYEKNYLIYFMAEYLNYRYIDHPEIKEQIKQQNLHQILIKELVHFDFIDSCYQDAIECLLAIVDTPENAHIYNCILAIIDCLSLDTKRILKRIQKMENIKIYRPEELINSYEVIDLIYLKLKGIAVPEENETLEKLKSLKSIITPNEIQSQNPDIQTAINYVLIIILNAFYGQPRDSITLINSIFIRHPKLTRSRSALSVYLINILAIATARLHPGEQANKLERIVIGLYESKNRKPTLYAQSLLLILKAQQNKNKKVYQMAINLTKEAIAIFKRNNLFLYELWMYNLMISIYTEMQDLDNVNHYNYKKMSRLEAKNMPFLSLEYIGRD